MRRSYTDATITTPDSTWSYAYTATTNAGGDTTGNYTDVQARSQYDFSTGLLTGFKDRNGVISQTFYNDAFNRPTMVKSALGVSGVESHARMYYAPQTIYGVTLANNDVLAATDLTTLDDGQLRSWTHTDGFGRTIEGWTKDPQGDVKTETIYDALGRTKQTSNRIDFELLITLYVSNQSLQHL
jgi:hypothetical protein